MKRILIVFLLVAGLYGLTVKSEFVNDLVFDYEAAENTSYLIPEEEMNQIYVEAPEQETPKSVIGKRPVTLEIPSLEVNTFIKEVGLAKNGAMATLRGAEKIAWYKYGAVPGGEGNAILAGHKDWNGKIGSLFHLEKMKKGETVTISYENDKKQKFVLKSLNVYPMNSVPKEVMSLKGNDRLTIITCAGKHVKSKGGYQSRAIAIFEKVES